MGVAERFNEKKKKTTGIYNGVEHRYSAKSAEQVGKEISSRVGTWLENNNNFVANYQDRYKSENTGYRADASDWLSTVTTQKSNFDSEAENIKSLLDEYKDYFDPEWVSQITSALDVSSQAQILRLLMDICRQQHTSAIFVSHDLAVISCLCDRVMVMRGGSVVEQGEIGQVIHAPKEDYTRRLVESVLQI